MINQNSNVLKEKNKAELNLLFSSNTEPEELQESSATVSDHYDEDGVPLSEDEANVLESLMSDWFSDANLDLLPIDEGGELIDAPEVTHHSPNVTSKFETVSVDEEDYPDGPERVAFELIKINTRNAHVQTVKEKIRFKAIEWLFIPNHGEMPFDLCCQALGVRPNLVRLRLMYQFHKKWLVFAGPLPFVAQGLPEIMCGEVLYDEGDNGLQLAKKIWAWPSIKLTQIETFCRERKIPEWEKILARMEQKGLISNRVDNWYFTGRNPSDMGIVRRNAFNWTKVAI